MSEIVMDKQTLIERLLALPGAISKAEHELLDASNGLQNAKDKLENREAELLASGVIDGKNAETRKAQLTQQTETERSVLRESEEKQARKRIALARLQNELTTYRSVARLMAGSDD